MINNLHYFFEDAVAQKVLLGVAVIGFIAGIVGVFSFLRKKTLVADAISHAVLPGVCVGFIFAGTKDPVVLMIAAVVVGWLSVWMIDMIVRTTKLTEDAAIAIISTFFFAIGSVLLSYISKSENAEQTGLKNFLFGNAATMTELDVNVFVIVSFVILFVVVLFFKQFKLFCFDEAFSKVIGLKVKSIEFLLSTLTVLAVAIGIQAVGVVLMSALLIAPASAARYWTNKLSLMLVIAGLFGLFSGVSGVVISTFKDGMPTGPWIVTVLFLFTILTLLFAPKKGWYSIKRLNSYNKFKIMEENLLKVFFQYLENGKEELKVIEILEKRPVETNDLEKVLARLIKKGFLLKKGLKYQLTINGNVEAMRIVRSHRLWELYLTRRMKFKDDHIHGSAETIEHLITPEIELELLKELNFPKEDPHNKAIPYDNRGK
ncbi:metal ABC transporter permease [Crocinitomicaceae bacterium]|nr:metal ABC transporter permease [Crocinitomicaceae bacterium]